jgi:predicted GIY-YIG superfamily endonuclease
MNKPKRKQRCGYRYVYFLERRGKVEYVGCSLNPLQRFACHQTWRLSGELGLRKNDYTIRFVYRSLDWDKAIAFEAKLIKAIKPPLNLRKGGPQTPCKEFVELQLISKQ